MYDTDLPRSTARAAWNPWLTRQRKRARCGGNSFTAQTVAFSERLRATWSLR